MVFILASEHLDKHLLVWQDITASDLDEKFEATIDRLEAEGKSVCTAFSKTSRNYHEFTKIFDAHNVDYDSKLPTTNSRSNDVLSTETPLRGDGSTLSWMIINAPADLVRVGCHMIYPTASSLEKETVSAYQAQITKLSDTYNLMQVRQAAVPAVVPAAAPAAAPVEEPNQEPNVPEAAGATAGAASPDTPGKRPRATTSFINQDVYESLKTAGRSRIVDMTAHAAEEALDMTTIDGIQKCIEFVPEIKTGPFDNYTEVAAIDAKLFDVYKQLFAFGYDGLRPSKGGGKKPRTFLGMDNVSCEKYHVRVRSLRLTKPSPIYPDILIQVQRGAGTKWDTLVQASDDLKALKKAMIDAGFLTSHSSLYRLKDITTSLAPLVPNIKAYEAKQSKYA
jgi:hypothetical protein